MILYSVQLIEIYLSIKNTLLTSLKSLVEIIFINISSIAEKVASPHRKHTIIFRLVMLLKNRNKNKNNKNPVILLLYVCQKAIVLYLTNPINKEIKRINMIIPIQTNIHQDHLKIGKIIIIIENIKIKSAILSRVAPIWLTQLKFLAIKPSNTSLRPQIK